MKEEGFDLFWSFVEDEIDESGFEESEDEDTVIQKQYIQAELDEVNVIIDVAKRITNNANHSEDFERTFTASQSYETTKTLNEVQEELVTQMCKDICDQIFNATVANW